MLTPSEINLLSYVRPCPQKHGQDTFESTVQFGGLRGWVLEVCEPQHAKPRVCAGFLLGADSKRPAVSLWRGHPVPGFASLPSLHLAASSLWADGFSQHLLKAGTSSSFS